MVQRLDLSGWLSSVLPKLSKLVVAWRLPARISGFFDVWAPPQVAFGTCGGTFLPLSRTGDAQQRF